MKSKTFEETQKAKKKQIEPLFPYGDWITIVAGVIILSKTDGMGHHLGHAGIFLLMLALIARPMSFCWKQPLKKRRTIGIFAFAAILAHAIYAFDRILNGNWKTILNMSLQHQWGMWTGIIALMAITPAAVTSFKFFQKKLGNRWRQIHLLSVPALAIATMHVVLIGPHYMAHLQVDAINHLRTYIIAIATLLVFLMRQQVFWSVLKFKKTIK